MMTGFRLQLIGTLSGGQKSRVAFAALSLQRPHVLLLDEVSEPVLQKLMCADRWYSRPITSIVSKQSAQWPIWAPNTDCPTHSPRYRCFDECYRELERRGDYHLARRAVHQYHCQRGKSKNICLALHSLATPALGVRRGRGLQVQGRRIIVQGTALLSK
jgi:hypothetical protein